MSEKEKRRQKRTGKKAASPKRRGRKTSPALDLPPPGAMEQTMQSVFGGPPADPRSMAQDLAYQAMEARDPKQMIELASQALKLNPRCVDAILIMAGLACRTPEELLKWTERAVQAGEEDLGERFFKENRGMFWGLIETRPYMRARASLADLLAKAGRINEAVEHLEAMLKLNPGDNQGLRYVLLGHYLALDRVDDAGRLFDAYPDEGSAMFAWARVLHDLLADDQALAREDLKRARETNPFAEAYLSGRKRLPRQLPDYYGIGDENEGIVCAVEIGDAWAKHPAAREWLRQAGA